MNLCKMRFRKTETCDVLISSLSRSSADVTLTRCLCSILMNVNIARQNHT